MDENKYTEALKERALHTNHYLRGLLVETQTGKTFASKLQLYKEALYRDRCMSRQANSYAAAVAVDDGKELRCIKLSVVLFVIAFLISMITKDSEQVILPVFFIIISGIAMAIASREIGWGMAVLFFPIIFIIVDMSVFMMMALPVIVFFVVFGRKYWTKTQYLKSQRETVSSYKSSVPELRKSLTEMIPHMRNDLQEWQEQWYQRYSDVLTEEDLLDYQTDEAFPPLFWWQLDATEVKQTLRGLECSRYGSWETKILERAVGKEFRTEEEYSPLGYLQEWSHEEVIDFYCNRVGCDIYDVLSRLTVLEGTSVQTTSYEVPAHSELEQLSVNMSVMGLANRIDKSYRDGEMTDSEYRGLSYKMFELGTLAGEYNNQTKTEYETEYIPIHNHSTFWTGQFFVCQGNLANNKPAIMIMQYYCQIPHMIENLDILDAELEGLPISYIDYDFHQCNPYFLAEFYSRHPQCA